MQVRDAVENLEKALSILSSLRACAMPVKVLWVEVSLRWQQQHL